MREVLDELDRRYRAGEAVAVGTVVSTFRSAPRPPGASMLVAGDGTVAGSVSGGCVEGAVYELAQDVIGDGTPVLERYGVSDDDAFSVGLTCGGIIDVFVERIDSAGFPSFADVVAALSEPGGYFDTDNLISNEASYLHVMGGLRELGLSGGAYLGVGPDQNFSYIAHVRPRILLPLPLGGGPRPAGTACTPTPSRSPSGPSAGPTARRTRG